GRSRAPGPRPRDRTARKGVRPWRRVYGPSPDPPSSGPHPDLFTGIAGPPSVPGHRREGTGPGTGGDGTGTGSGGVELVDELAEQVVAELVGQVHRDPAGVLGVAPRDRRADLGGGPAHADAREQVVVDQRRQLAPPALPGEPARLGLHVAVPLDLEHRPVRGRRRVEAEKRAAAGV